jgi:DNA-binding transcriptional ArsR family regulator
MTASWRATNDIVRKVGGDKSAIIQALKRLLEMGYLETRPDKNKIFYKRRDTTQSEFDFIRMMVTFEQNQKTELNAINQIPTIMMSDEKRFRKKGLELLEHIQEEVNRAYMVTVRIDYQQKLGILPYKIVKERKEKLDKYIEKIMSTILNKYQDKKTRNSIQEYFQNHTMKLEFKI